MLSPEQRELLRAGGVPAREAFHALWRDPGGPEPARARTERTDAALRALWEGSGALVAVGGYGRGRLFRGSDLDLLVLRVDELGDDERVEDFVRRLWDLGLEVGHGTRTLAGCAEVLRRDLAAATALLEGRLVCGDEALFARLQAEAARFRAEERERFSAAKLAEAEERYRRFGSVCLLAPDLKQGRGQARDLELARLLAALWVDEAPLERDPRRVLPWGPRALEAWLELDPREASELAAAEATLQRARGALHDLAPGQGDRLAPHLQADLAERLGVGGRGGRLALEVALEQIYRAAKRVDRLVRRARLRLQPPPEVALRQPLAPGVAACGDEVLLDPVPPEEPSALLELFRQAQRTQRRVSLRTLEEVRAVLAGDDPARRVASARLPVARRDPPPRRPRAFRLDAPAVTGFRDLLRGGRGVAQVVSAMHEAGLLRSFLPEFSVTECLAQADPYHVYTVDEHTLAALRALEGEAPHAGHELTREREDRLREELFLRTRRRDLLRLALILHDCGKVGGSHGHTERSVTRVPGVARRLGLGPGEERHVAFLVGASPKLSRMAERRDVDTPETVASLVELCARDPLRLEHLYLLTCADVLGVAPGALTRWKDTLLTRLYERAAQEIAGTAPPASPESVSGWLEALRGRVDQGALEAHLEQCPPSYLAAIEEGELLLHLELIEALEGEPPLALHWALEQGFARVWISTLDRHGLLSQLCGALSGAGWDILGLEASERRDGLVFDRFALVAGPGATPSEEVAALVRRVLIGALDPGELIAARVRRAPPLPPTAAPAPLRIRLDDEALEDATLIDVTAPDRVGLLYDLTRALRELDLDIDFAKVVTKGNRAVDVFHVQAPGGGPVPFSQREEVLGALLRAAQGADPASLTKT